LAPVGVKSLSLIAFGILIILGAAGSTYELIATYSFRRHGAHGQLVTVRGYRQYIDCRGTGSPTIVFDGGLGDASDVWRDLHAQAAQISKACIFDRLGNGWSDDGPKPRSSEQMTGELHALLSASGQTAPYVLSRIRWPDITLVYSSATILKRCPEFYSLMFRIRIRTGASPETRTQTEPHSSRSRLGGRAWRQSASPDSWVTVNGVLRIAGVAIERPWTNSVPSMT